MKNKSSNGVSSNKTKEVNSKSQQSDGLKKTMIMGTPTKEQTLEPKGEAKKGLRQTPQVEPERGEASSGMVVGAGAGPVAGPVVGSGPVVGAGPVAGPKSTLTGHVASNNASNIQADSELKELLRPSENPRPSESRPSESRPSESRPSESRPSESRPSENRSSGHLQGNKLADAKPGAEKTGDAQKTLIQREELDKDVEDLKQETMVGRAAFQSGEQRATVLPEIILEGSIAKLIHEQRERFESVTALGSGAAGDVLLAVDKDVRRKVAIKTLKKEIHDPKLIGRFVEEIRTVGELEHPNIPPIHDVGINAEGQYFFVMKYMDGVTLTEIIRRLREGDKATHAVYTFEKRAMIISEVCKALSFAHSKGFIHRDIKPDNIMIGRHGEVVLMDWGIAKRIDPDSEKVPFLDTIMEEGNTSGEFEQNKRRSIETMQGTLLGTPFYMSPEQARGENENLDQRSDIYSVCAVFHEFLTLRHYLSHHQSLDDVLKGVIEDEPDLAMMVSNPHQTRPPADLSHVIRKGMQKDPDKRFQTVEELIELLEKVRAGYLPVQCPFTLSKRTAFAPVHLVDKHPFMAVFLFALFGLGFIGMLINTILNLF